MNEKRLRKITENGLMHVSRAIVVGGVAIAAYIGITSHRAEAAERGRFGISDMTQVATVSIWLVHDAAHPAQCLLMVKTGAALTATPWMCL